MLPASEPRAQLTVKVDLATRRDCEEAFGLALYADRGVELIEWDTDSSACTQRRARVRYVPTRISRDALLTRIRSLSTKIEVMTP
jgi:hypothetical protein